MPLPFLVSCRCGCAAAACCRPVFMPAAPRRMWPLRGAAPAAGAAAAAGQRIPSGSPGGASHGCQRRARPHGEPHVGRGACGTCACGTRRLWDVRGRMVRRLRSAARRARVGMGWRGVGKGWRTRRGCTSAPYAACSAHPSWVLAPAPMSTNAPGQAAVGDWRHTSPLKMCRGQGGLGVARRLGRSPRLLPRCAAHRQRGGLSRMAWHACAPRGAVEHPGP